MRRTPDDDERAGGDRSDPPTRLLMLGIAFFALAVTVLIRLYYLQVLDHRTLTERAVANHVRWSRTEAPRGRVLSSDGQTVLVDNRVSLSVGVDLGRLGEGDERARVVDRLAGLLGMPAAEIERRLARPKVPAFNVIPIADDVPQDVMVRIKEFAELYPGIVPITRPVRSYPARSCATPDPASCLPLAPHVLGYVGETNDKDLDRDKSYSAGDSIGRSGIESSLERELRGTAGRRKLEVSSRGRVLRVLGEEPARQGNDVVLGIDPNIQRYTEEALRQGIEMARTHYPKDSDVPFAAPAGAAVVLDSRDGTVLAMASYPTFDPSQFTSGISQADYTRLTDAASQFPLNNRAIQGLYPPGSTFKVVTAAAALANGFIEPDDTISAGPYFEAGKRKFRDWKPGGHGITDLRKSLVDSVDVYYYKLGHEMYKRRGEGEFLQDAARKLGLGQRNGIDLPGEKTGRVPDAAWKQSVHDAKPTAYPDREWYPGDSINLSIGQGDLVVTPLQMATIYGAIANGGTVWRPHVLREVRSQSGQVLRQVAPEPIGQMPIGRDLVDEVASDLLGVTTEGTARAAFAGFPLDEHPIAGKTGTAQVSGKQDQSWFVSFAGPERQYVVAVTVEQGGHGGEVAAPISRLIYERIFGIETEGIHEGAVSD